MDRKLKLVFYLEDAETKATIGEKKQMFLTFDESKVETIADLKRKWDELNEACANGAAARSASEEQKEAALAAFQAWYDARKEINELCEAAGISAGKMCRIQIEDYFAKAREPA